MWVTVVTADTSAISGVTDDQGNTYTDDAENLDRTPRASRIGIWGYAAMRRARGRASLHGDGARRQLTWGFNLQREYAGDLTYQRASEAFGTGAESDSGAVAVQSSRALLVAAQTHCQMSTTGVGAGWMNLVVPTEAFNKRFRHSRPRT